MRFRIERGGSFLFEAELRRAMDLIAKGAVDLPLLVTATLPLDSAEEAFQPASDRTQSMKVQLCLPRLTGALQ
ncbi:hypothetical protein [Chelativorans salis]|uniref:Uncharacterized protein n=1 Tax=Chelativorans salis TaxID=2978478 RepID=A0ABT2LTS5_9HYPH|nr:hypothetical protein [Chelativorans sp. EGI FJ00035]MCT7377936.1 hypothetical protein [Chelativorans sp. EGI FJ00035]